MRVNIRASTHARAREMSEHNWFSGLERLGNSEVAAFLFD
jgi:hypothetical protein